MFMFLNGGLAHTMFAECSAFYGNKNCSTVYDTAHFVEINVKFKT